ncbi:MAG: hypothetical protein OJF49_001677 [Ktedonobacterales bacterium]|nr:MAG: hypothetical protein OJF49_001677 [Ktedonobacterales bacterium]
MHLFPFTAWPRRRLLAIAVAICLMFTSILTLGGLAAGHMRPAQGANAPVNARASTGSAAGSAAGAAQHPQSTRTPMPPAKTPTATSTSGAKQTAHGGSGASTPATQADSVWTTYLHDLGHTSYNGDETLLTGQTASTLAPAWTLTLPNTLSAQPVVVNGMVYIGAWDGNEYAYTTAGVLVWSQFLGTMQAAQCRPSSIGIAATPTIANGVLYISGGAGVFYALDALTGAILWQTTLGDPSVGEYLWSSPTVSNGHIYVGMASLGDCPLVQGRVYALNATTGQVEQTFYTVPSGCIGASVWGSIAVDEQHGALYFATGNSGTCNTPQGCVSAGTPTGGSCPTPEIYGESIISLSTSDFSLLGRWSVPSGQLVYDSDWGSSPQLWTATWNGATEYFVGATNKNGWFYAFDALNVGRGPKWSVQVASGGSCPQCGAAAIAGAVWDGTTLYLSGNKVSFFVPPATIQVCNANVQAVNPLNGAPLWHTCFQNTPILGTLAGAPGVLAVPVGNTVVALSTVDGSTLATYTDSSGKLFWGPVTIADGTLYAGNQDGLLVALRPS